MQEHGKGIAGVITAGIGAVIAHWPLVEAGIRDVGGITAMVSAIYATLYFRRAWKKA